MSKSSLFRLVLIGLITSFIAASVFWIAVTLTSFGLAWMLSLSVATTFYLTYLNKGLDGSSGLLFCLLLLSVCAGLSFFLSISVGLFALICVGIIWLAKMAQIKPSPLKRFIELGVLTISFLVAYFVYLKTGSIAMSVWSFFICQAFTLLDAPRFQRKESEDLDGQFEIAYQTAEKAINELS